MRVSAALLDLPNEARSGIPTDRGRVVSADATLRCDLTKNAAWKRRCLTFYASVSQTNKHEETAVAIAIRGVDIRETSREYLRRKLTATR